MTEFCEGCPMRGRIDGEVQALLKQEVLEASIHRGLFSTSEPVITNRRVGGVLMDETRNPSMPIWIGSIETVDNLCKRIDECEAPIVVEQQRLFRKPKMEFHCPAIGRIAISQNDEAFKMIAQQTNL